jgi:hypothetical protein
MAEEEDIWMYVWVFVAAMLCVAACVYVFGLIALQIELLTG